MCNFKFFIFFFFFSIGIFSISAEELLWKSVNFYGNGVTEYLYEIDGGREYYYFTSRSPKKIKLIIIDVQYFDNDTVLSLKFPGKIEIYKLIRTFSTRGIFLTCINQDTSVPQKYEKISLDDSLEGLRALVLPEIGLILRESCSVNSKKILTLPYDSTIRIIRRDREDYINNILSPWYIVKYYNYIGCVFGGYIRIIYE